MAEKISDSKGFDEPAFDTYVPELEEAADIRNALELFFYGNSEDGNATGDVSLYETLIDFDTRISQNDASFDGHVGAISDVHGVGSGSEVVGTIKAQTLTNKTLTSPTITSPTISSPTVTGTATLPSTTSIGNVSSTEISYVDGVTSPIQTQINTNTPTGMISIHSAATAPTGWLLCDGTSYGSASYTTLFNVIGYTFGGSGANFSVPNLKGKVVVGIDGAQAQFDTRGETGGSMNHQHAASNSGNTAIGHDHTIPALSGNAANVADHNHTVTVTNNNSGNHGHGDNIGTANAGSHNHNTTGSSGSNTVNAGSNLSIPSNAHNHIISNTGSHSHTINGSVSAGGDHSHANTAANTGAGGHGHNVGTTASATTGGAGGTHSHTTPASTEISNLQPYMALNYIIKF
jgi:microcystin-dependent protein